VVYISDCFFFPTDSLTSSKLSFPALNFHGLNVGQKYDVFGNFLHKHQWQLLRRVLTLTFANEPKNRRRKTNTHRELPDAQEIGANGKGRGAKREKGDGKTSRDRGGEIPAWLALCALCDPSFSLYFPRSARECRGLGEENETRFLAKAFRIFPIDENAIKAVLGKEALQDRCPYHSILLHPFRSCDSLSALRVRLFLSLLTIMNFEYSFPFFPLSSSIIRKTHKRDITNRECCCSSRQNGIDEIVVSGSAGSAFFSKGLHFVGRTCHSSRASCPHKKYGNVSQCAKNFHGAGRY